MPHGRHRREGARRRGEGEALGHCARKRFASSFLFPSEYEYGLRAGCAQRVYKECSIVGVAQMVRTCFMLYS